MPLKILQHRLFFLCWYCTCCCPHNGWAWGRRRRGLCRAQQTHPGWAARPPGCHLYCRPSAAPLQPQPSFAAHQQLISSNQFIRENVLTQEPVQLRGNTLLPVCSLREVLLLSAGVTKHKFLGGALQTPNCSINTTHSAPYDAVSQIKSTLRVDWSEETMYIIC